jgi:hypothetical protein
MLIKGSLSDDKNDQVEACSFLYAAGTITDTGGQKRIKDKLNPMAYYDSFTQLPNQSMFTYRTTAVPSQNRMQSGSGVLYQQAVTCERDRKSRK